jgi:hypothetical protein
LSRVRGQQRRRFVVFAVMSFAALTYFVPRSASAGGATPEQQAEARKEMRQAIEELDAGHPEVALAGFRRAMELVPEANAPHRYAARALEDLARWEEAIDEYETYLRIKADVSDAEAVRATIETLRTTHVTGRVVWRCTPPDVTVAVDGADAPLGPERELRLVKGVHQVRVRAPGYVDRELAVDVVPGATITPPCALALQPAPSPRILGPIGGSGPTTSETPNGTSHPFYTRWWFWTGAGAVVAGSIVTILVLSRSSTSPPSTEGGNHAFP